MGEGRRREGEQTGGGGKRTGRGSTRSIFSPWLCTTGRRCGEWGGGGADTLLLPLRVGQLPLGWTSGRGCGGGSPDFLILHCPPPGSRRPAEHPQPALGSPPPRTPSTDQSLGQSDWICPRGTCPLPPSTSNAPQPKGSQALPGSISLCPPCSAVPAHPLLLSRLFSNPPGPCRGGGWGSRTVQLPGSRRHSPATTSHPASQGLYHRRGPDARVPSWGYSSPQCAGRLSSLL